MECQSRICSLAPMLCLDPPLVVGASKETRLEVMSRDGTLRGGAHGRARDPVCSQKCDSGSHVACHISDRCIGSSALIQTLFRSSL